MNDTFQIFQDLMQIKHLISHLVYNLNLAIMILGVCIKVAFTNRYNFHQKAQTN